MPSVYFNQMIGHVLRPLARLTIRFGGTFPALRDELKRAFFDVASAERDADGRPPTDSRIALVTGLHRKDIRAFRESEKPPQFAIPLATQIRTVWTSDLLYLDARGGELPLPRKRSVGKERSFEALVGRLDKNIRSRTVLDQLIARDEVSLNENDEVVLSPEGVSARSGEERKIFEAISMIGECANSFVLSGQGERKNFAFNFFSSLTSEAADELYIDGRRMVKNVYSKLNLLGIKHETQTDGAQDARHRVYFGFFQVKVDQDRFPELHAMETRLK